MKIFNYVINSALSIGILIGYHSAQGQASWTSVSSGTTQNLNGISFSNSIRGIVVGASGTIRKTNNAGATWSAATSPSTTVIFRDVYMAKPNSQKAYLCGDQGNIYYSSNFGTSWAAQGPYSGNPAASLYGLSFVDSANGTVCGTQGIYGETSNLGSTWTNVGSGVTNTLRGIHFTSTSIGWVVGASGVIRKTIDGGTTWTAQSSGTTTETFVDVHFVNSNTGCTVGTNGQIRFTTNGGTTWTSQTSGTTATLRSVHLVSATNGWIVGDGGVILTTSNGGTTWTSQTSGTTANLNSVYMHSANLGWAAGDGGTILNYCVAPAQPGTITGSTSVCAGSSHTYTIAAVSGATSYNWTLPSGWTGSSTTNSITVTIGSTSGSISVTAQAGTCVSTARTLSITTVPVLPNPGTISGNTNVCSGSVQTYSITPVSGALSYTWTMPSGWTGSTSTASISPTAGSTGGNITVIANGSGVCSSPSSSPLAVSVTPSPAQPGSISGATSICSTDNTSKTYSIAAVSGAISYTWTLPSGWAGTSTTTSISATPGTSGGTISVAAFDGTCNSIARTLSITVVAPPSTPQPINGLTSQCSGTSSNSYVIASVSGATSYTWTLPAGWTGSSTTTSITPTVGTYGGTISVVANNSACISSPRTLSISVSTAPAQPGSITGNTLICGGTSQTYSVAAVAGATSYTWTLPTGWTGTSTANSITATAGNSGNITVKANTGTCGSAATSLAISVTPPLSAAGSITGSSSVCSGTTQSYSISPVSGATSYTWTLPSGWSGSSTTNSINASVGNSGGTISVVAQGGSCSSASSPLTVSVTPTPTQPSAISGSTTVCSSTSQTYTVSSVAGISTYNWTLPSGWSGSSTSNSIAATTGASGGTISVTASNSCGTSSASTVTVTISGSGSTPSAPGAISGNTSSCPGSTETYSISPVAGATSYLWTLPGGWTGNSTSTSINATTSSNGGSLSVMAINACGSSSLSNLTISITDINNGVSVSGNILTASESGATYQWLDCNNSNSPISGETNQSFTGNPAGSYSVVITKNGCTKTSTCYSLPLSTNDQNLSALIIAFPNPTQSLINLTTDPSFIGLELSVYDSFGHLVKKEIILSESVLLNLNDQSSGLYFIGIEHKKGILKIIKE